MSGNHRPGDCCPAIVPDQASLVPPGAYAGHLTLLRSGNRVFLALGVERGGEMAAVPLSDAIADLREQLQKAIAAGGDEELRFELGSVVLELEMTLNTSAGGNVKASLWSVVTVGGSADRARGSAHRLTLNLIPRLASTPRRRVLVGDDTDELPPRHPVEDDEDD